MLVTATTSVDAVEKQFECGEKADEEFEKGRA